MHISESPSSGKIFVDCTGCGKMFEIDDFRGTDFAEIAEISLSYYRVCDECRLEAERAAAEEAAAKLEELKADCIRRLPEMLKRAGIPEKYSRDRDTGQLFTAPPCRNAAEWIYRRRKNNILLSGETGTGKSTSACFVAAIELLAGEKIRYSTLRQLLSEWKEAKTSDRDYAVESMLRSIFGNDIFIIDEVVGKARISESGQELLFEILESVNSGVCGARIWLLGNFYEGSIEDIFSDPEPVRRRLQENFSCAFIDRKKQTITPLTVWKE